jgi:methionyl aminopeptidase
MNCLVQQGIVEEYVPLMDIKGSYSAQFEHVGYSKLPVLQ